MTSTPTPTQDPEIPPDPDADYRSTCDYLLGNFTQSASGYRFVGGAKITNTGNVGVKVEVKARWDQLGTKPIIETKIVTIPYNGRKSVQFTKIASGDQIDLHQSACDAGDACGVKVSLIDFFEVTH